jgi:hypothetical protein
LLNSDSTLQEIQQLKQSQGEEGGLAPLLLNSDSTLQEIQQLPQSQGEEGGLAPLVE